MPPVIACAEVTKCYDTRQPDAMALAGVDLAIEPGELVAIMGPSGCGKSTLLHILGGLDSPTAGTVTLVGERIDRLSEAKRAVLRRSRIGYVFQFFNLIANLTAGENVELPLLLTGSTPSEASRRASALLDRLDVGDQAAKVPSALSGGQQQRVALARALANQPTVLLADEPTGNLDSVAARAVLSLIQEQHRDGQTIVMVTHDRRVAETADRVVLMEDGRITDTFDPRHDRRPDAVADFQAPQSAPAPVPEPTGDEPGVGKHSSDPTGG